LSVSVWIATWTSKRSASRRQQSMAAGVEPQSSCSFSPIAPARICSSIPSGIEVLPLPRKPKFMDRLSVACSISSTWRMPGVQVVALVPVAGPVPPPMKVVTPLASAS
jgi:hypothetical protein